MGQMSELIAPLDILLDYLAVSDEPAPADVIIGLGSDCAAVGHRAAELFADGMAPWVLFAGGHGAGSGGLTVPEADFLKRSALAAGLPEAAILTERASTNTGENFARGFAVLAAHGIAPRRVLLITRPARQRRAWATARRRQPDVAFLNCPPPRPDLAALDTDALAALARLALGEVARLANYPARGFIIPQDIPEPVACAAEAASRALDALA